MDETQLHLGTLELAQTVGDGFQGALDVGLQDEVEGGRLASLDLLEQVFEPCPRAVGDGAWPATR